MAEQASSGWKSTARLSTDPRKLDMSTLNQRTLDSNRPGYWAVQIRLDSAENIGDRFLCHAENAPTASAMAARLMGSAAPVRGYAISWIDEHLLDSQGGPLPPLGQSTAVRDPVEWERLVAAHRLSEPPRLPDRGAPR
jgi:hypothetical protein